MANMQVTVVDGNNVTVSLDRGVAGVGIASVQLVVINNANYLEITYTNGTTQTVGPVGTLLYTGTSPINVAGSVISLTTVPVSLGGTGQTTAATGLNALLPLQTGQANKYLATDGTNASWNAVSVDAANITGVLPVLNGGTGQTSYTDGQLLIGNTTGNTLAKSTLTAGSGISIANGGGAITISATSSGGSVTSASVVSANGFAGTVANPTTTPAITLTTSLTGLLKGNGTAMSAAVSGTDYLAPPSGTALLKANSGGALANATAGTDYLAPPSGTALLKANSGGALANAVSGTDYAPATSGSSILYGNAGGFSNVTVGTGLSFSTGTLSSTVTGTVTSVSVVSANGFGGTVATATTTPAITLTTSLTGLLKGNGTSMSAAVSGTDYAPATSGSSILYGNAGGFSNVTIGTGLSFSAGTLSSTTAGTVTSVSFTGGIVSVATATTTPALTVAGTSGGIPYFSSGTTWATSAALTASAIVIGGGAGVAPSTTTTGTGVLTAVGNNVNTTGGLVTVDGSATLTNKTLTNPTITNYTETVNAPAAGSAFTVDLTTGTIQKYTTNANTTITLPSSVAGKNFSVIVAYGGVHTLTWAGGSVLKWAGGTAPTATSVSGKFDIFVFTCDGTNTYGRSGGSNF